jgi:type III restriction enzyme
MTKNFEVESPIINSPFEEPKEYWYLREDQPPELRDGRRPPIVYPPSEQKEAWDISEGVLKPAEEFPGGYQLELVQTLRERVKSWREQGYPGVTRTTLDLLHHWKREDREQRLFFAQLEAAETVIFLHEARSDFRQGLRIPRDEPSGDRRDEGYVGFRRYACKVATGGGKTTVMGMLAAWSILNKVADRSNKTYSDVVLVLCPNITIRNRLQELDTKEGEASLYRTRDLVPGHLMPQLSQGKVVITNWHVLERKTAQEARVMRTGVLETREERIYIGKENTTMRGMRYLTEKTYRQQVALGQLRPIAGSEETTKEGALKSVYVEREVYVESDTALVKRVLGREVGNKENILVFNDEAHHAYRIRPEEKGEDEEESVEEFVKEATVWVDGLDRIHKLRRINFCMDLSATPYFLARVGQETNKPFPWVVSDFGLVEAIESGLTKIPQLATRDPSGNDVPYYFNIWDWVLKNITPAERGGRKGDPKPEAVLKWACHPITMLAQNWEQTREKWEKESDDPRPPVFIIVCKNTKIAKAVYEWMAEGVNPPNIPPFRVDSLKNHDGVMNTVRIDSKVVGETDSGESKDAETRWMRLILDTAGRQDWPHDRQGHTLYPEDFEELAKKLGRPLHPPGRDVRCIVSVGMLTEGWDCHTVTHIIGLRPFMSQLLCEQVVGRGLRRASYELTEKGMFGEEVSKVLGVPFEVIPYKASEGAPPQPPVKRHHIYAIPQRKEEFEITFPRVEGYTQAIRNKITVDWEGISPINIDPLRIPPEVEVKAGIPDNRGRMSLLGPGKIEDIELERSKLRPQEVVFDLAQNLARLYIKQNQTIVPSHVLFPQLVQVVQQYLDTKVTASRPGDMRDVAFSPYFGYVIERLVEAIHPDTSEGEAPEVPIYESSRGPGSTTDVDFWTRKDIYEVTKSHLNAVVADTKKWEQSAAYFLDKHEKVRAFVKNERLGFAIPYLHNGQMHEYYPDFIIRLVAEDEQYLILETKGYDELADVKKQAAERWVAAVNVDGRYGRWQYAMAFIPTEVSNAIKLYLNS